VYLKDAGNYELGLLGLCMSNSTFVQWIFYAFWQSLMIVLICTLPYETQGGSYWLEGNFTYSSVVILANMKILSDTTSLDFFAIFWVILSISLFFICVFVADTFPEDELFGVMG